MSKWPFYLRTDWLCVVFYQKEKFVTALFVLVGSFQRSFQRTLLFPSLATKGVRSDFEGGRSGQVSLVGFVRDSLGLGTS